MVPSPRPEQFAEANTRYKVHYQTCMKQGIRKSQNAQYENRRSIIRAKVNSSQPGGPSAEVPADLVHWFGLLWPGPESSLNLLPKVRTFLPLCDGLLSELAIQFTVQNFLVAIQIALVSNNDIAALIVSGS